MVLLVMVNTIYLPNDENLVLLVPARLPISRLEIRVRSLASWGGQLRADGLVSKYTVEKTNTTNAPCRCTDLQLISFSALI